MFTTSLCKEVAWALLTENSSLEIKFGYNSYARSGLIKLLPLPVSIRNIAFISGILIAGNSQLL